MNALIFLKKQFRKMGQFRAIRDFFDTLLGGILVFGLRSVQTLAAMDWQLTETFYEFIYRVLLLVIGVELVCTLATHDLRAILE